MSVTSDARLAVPQVRCERKFAGATQCRNTVKMDVFCGVDIFGLPRMPVLHNNIRILSMIGEGRSIRSMSKWAYNHRLFFADVAYQSNKHIA